MSEQNSDSSESGRSDDGADSSALQQSRQDTTEKVSQTRPNSEFVGDSTARILSLQGEGADGNLARTVPLSTVSLVGSRLAGYLILSRLGRGGMAEVYAARDLELERDVAIKVLRADLSRDRDYIARFRREAKAAAKLNHPNIVQIYEVGEDTQRYYIAQELISGQNLRQYLDRNGALDSEQAVQVLYGVASALNAAAVEGITHRDIKPENLMWSKAGDVKVADFGLARLGNDADGSRAGLTQAGLTLGTPRYMSPEQVQGRPVDPRSDLYSLGVTMYHLLSGRPPFEADDPLALAFAHVNETPKPIDRVRGDKEVPEWLIAIVSKLMRKDPADRFQSPAELLDALTGDESDPHLNARRMAGVATATARLQRVADDEKRNRRRRRRRVMLLSLVPLACVGIGVACASQIPQASMKDLLRPDAFPEYGTVEEQFLAAVERDEVSAWEAVPAYFPPDENAVNQAYASKSSLQLARLYLDQNRLREADATLEAMLNDPDTGRKYRLIAMARRVEVLQLMGMPFQVTRAKRQLRATYNDLKAANSDAIVLFNQVFSPREQASLGLTTEAVE